MSAVAREALKPIAAACSPWFDWLEANGVDLSRALKRVELYHRAPERRPRGRPAEYGRKLT
jgi:hypothetical protein